MDTRNWRQLLGLDVRVVHCRQTEGAADRGSAAAWLRVCVLHDCRTDFSESVAPEAIRSSMQALIFAATTGIGLFIGTQFAGIVMDKYSVAGKFRSVQDLDRALHHHAHRRIGARGAVPESRVGTKEVPAQPRSHPSPRTTPSRRRDVERPQRTDTVATACTSSMPSQIRNAQRNGGGSPQEKVVRRQETVGERRKC